MARSAVSVLPDGQLLPAAAEVTVLARMWFPVSGLLTVTEKVTVAERPAPGCPVQVRSGLANDTDPGGRRRVGVIGGVVKHPGQAIGDARPGIGGLPGVGDRDRVADRLHPAPSWRALAVLVIVSPGVSTGTRMTLARARRSRRAGTTTPPRRR